MDASMRIRFGIVHLVSTSSYLDKQETNRDFLQIPGTCPDDEDIEDMKAIEAEHQRGNYDLRGKKYGYER